MRILRDLVLGVVLGSAVCVLLEVVQMQWMQAMERVPVSDPAIPALGLLAVGGLLAGLVLLPISPYTTGTAAVFLAILIGPPAGTSVTWWPDGLRGSPLQLGGFSGTYLALGVLVTVTIGRVLARRSTSVVGLGQRTAPGLPEAPDRDSMEL